MSSDHPQATPHDFRRTKTLDRFHLHTVQMVLASFARLAGTPLSTVLRQPSSLSLEDLDQVTWAELPPRAMLTPQHASVVSHQLLFGYTTEELRMILGPMARTGAEPIGSMGSDAAIAVLSDRSRLLYDYFTQLFAQVTNSSRMASSGGLVTWAKSWVK